MKSFWCLLLLFYSFHIGAQSFSTENDFKNYLIENIDNIDPLEGIWSGELITKNNFSSTSGSMNLPSFSSDLRLCIIKKNDFYYAYPSDKYFKIILEPKDCINFTFEKTSKPGEYLVDFSCINLNSNGTANLYNNSLNFSITDKKFDPKSNSITTKENILKLTKISLNEDDIKAALNKNSKNSNKQSSHIKSRGTAFAIGDRYVVTAYHVVNGFNQFKIEGVNGDFNTSYNCWVIASDSINDLAILYIYNNDFKEITNIPYSIKSNPCKVGESSFCLGYPLINSMGQEIKLTNGIISSSSGFLGDTLQYQISVPVQPGNSGGPLFDHNGYLIGIIIAKHSEAENASYALKISCLKNKFEEIPNFSWTPYANKLKGLSLPTQVELIKNYVYIIEAEK